MAYIKQALPKTTPKEMEVTKLLYKFRILNTHHFQKIFNHKNPRTIQQLLANLVIKKIIYTDYTKKTFISKPAEYCLDLKGRAILKQEKKYDLVILNRTYRDKTRKPQFIKKCFSIANLYIYFLKLQKTDGTLKFLTNSNLLKYTYLDPDLVDAYITIKNTKGTKRYLLKIFDAYTPKGVYRAIVKQYIQFFDSGDWEDNTNNVAFPGVLFVFPHERIKLHIFHYSKAIIEDKFSLFLTTTKRIQSTISKGTIWQKVH